MVEIFSKAANFGSVEAHCGLGCVYGNRESGLEKDKAMAEYYYEISAKVEKCKTGTTRV